MTFTHNIYTIWHSFLQRAAMAGAMATLGLTPSASAQDGPPPAQVAVAEAVETDMAPVVDMPGTIVSRSDSRIAAAIAGAVTWIADVGASVDEGDIIAKIDDRDWVLDLKDRQADIERLEARLAYLSRQAERIRELAARGNSPQSRLDEAITDRDSTAQELAQARVALARTEVNVARTTVRAPFSGRVVERLAGQGEYASAGTEMVRLVDTRNLEVRAQIPVTLADTLSAGQSVTVQADGGRVEGAPIRTLVPVGDEISRTLELRVTAPANAWLVGTAVRVGLPSGQTRRVVAVPRDALVLRPGAVYVYVVGDENKARRISVATGAAEGELIEVDGDLKAGEKVIIRGGERLRPGQLVDISAQIGAWVAATGR